MLCFRQKDGWGFLMQAFASLYVETKLVLFQEKSKNRKTAGEQIPSKKAIMPTMASHK